MHIQNPVLSKGILIMDYYKPHKKWDVQVPWYIPIQKLKKQADYHLPEFDRQVSIGGVKGHGAEPLGVTEASTAPKAAY